MNLIIVAVSAVELKKNLYNEGILLVLQYVNTVLIQHPVNAEFVKSNVNQEDCPSDGKPEFALVGRSNVGKSSLLNSIVRRKKLALTSKTPGKTQCINHFRINDSWYLVDLPGYGYALHHVTFEQSGTNSPKTTFSTAQHLPLFSFWLMPAFH